MAERHFIGLSEMTHCNAPSSYDYYTFSVPDGKDPKDHFFQSLVNDYGFWELNEWRQHPHDWEEFERSLVLYEIVGEPLDLSDFAERMLVHLKKEAEENDSALRSEIIKELKKIYGLELDEAGLNELRAHMSRENRKEEDGDVFLGSGFGNGANWETKFRDHVIRVVWDFRSQKLLGVLPKVR